MHESYKKCSCCKEEKPYTEFSISINNKDGLGWYCKQCDSIKNKQSHTKNGKYKLTSWISNILAQHRKKFDVDIDTLELTEKWKDIKHCQSCDIKLDWSYGKGKTNNNSPSIDRINNEKLMNIINVQLICYQCNRLKSDNTMTKFIASCKKIVNFNKKISYDIPGTQIRFDC